VRVELPVADLGLGLDRYETAAMLLDRWQEEGTVGRDERPALYAYRMTSPDGGSSTGVIGALGLGEPDEETDILPTKRRSPRRGATASTAACDEGQPLPHLGAQPGKRLSATSATWPLPTRTSSTTTASATSSGCSTTPTSWPRWFDSVASAPVVVADGHHRYQTARTYQAERRAATNGAPGPTTR